MINRDQASFRLSALGVLALMATVVTVAGLSPRPLATLPAATIEQTEAGLVNRDVTYCTAGGVDLKMDLYFPKAQNARPAPVALYVHGGGWTGGDKAWVDHIISSGELTSRGYLVASVNYRLAPQHKWPAQIEDVKCAVRHLRANAAKYNLDPSRIGAWGESAGGHLVSLLGLAGAGEGLEGSGGYPEQSSRVQAVVDMCGPSDFTGVELSGYASELVRLLLGVTPEKAKDAVRRASPVTYVTWGDPPFLILHGDKDPIVSAAQSQKLYDRLTASGVPATLVMVKDAGHVFAPVGKPPISPTMPEIQRMVYDFFDRDLRGANTTTRYFPETGKIAQGKFLEYWNVHGGLAQQGYPISDELQEKSDTDGNTYTTQYFERAVFEYHPENQPPYDMLLSLLGSYRYRQKYPGGALAQAPNASPGSALFPETGKRLGGRFLEYWTKNGGLAQQGYPISDEFTEVSELDGKPYTVQYFERAVFERHLENPPPNDVLLSQLGTFRYRARQAGGGQ